VKKARLRGALRHSGEAFGRRIMATFDLSVRIAPGNPDHHIWNNHGTWWCHYTIHRPDFTKHRVRVSLRTRAKGVARRKRDALLARASCSECNELL
jgi:hypothetical protein